MPDDGDHDVFEPRVLDRPSEERQRVHAPGAGVDQPLVVVCPAGLVLLRATMVVDGVEHAATLASRGTQVDGRLAAVRADLEQRPVRGGLATRVVQRPAFVVGHEADRGTSRLEQAFFHALQGTLPRMEPETQAPDRNLALELVRVTEAAALAAGRWLGKGDKNGADGAAVDAMRIILNSVSMEGVVVIGEGEKDEAPMLFNGEEIGAGGPACDIAVDPIDGTTLTSLGRNNAISVIAIAERGTMFDPGPCVYMDKIAVGPEAADVIDLDAPIEANLEAVAKAKGEDVDDITAVVLDRPRHEDIIRQCREAGARIKLIQDGDVAAAITVATPGSGTDILFGIGGTPEGVIAAAALKCMGGEMFGRLYPRNDEERQAAVDAGYDLDRVLTSNDLVSGDDVFFSATGISDGDLLKGVRYWGNGASTQSMVMRSKSGTIRTIDATHQWQKLMKYSALRFD